MRSKQKKIKDKKFVILVIILIILAIVTGILLAIKVINSKIEGEQVIELGAEQIEKEQEPEPQIQIYQGEQRPIAVMIDNVRDAWPQAGLNDAYIVYEIIVEGGLTRLMAVFKGEDLDKIGPVRSSRHYFLDYALENDAIYVHYGQSPKAESDIAGLKINTVNGMVDDYFTRVKDKKNPHDAVISTQDILEASEKKNYRTTSKKESILNYTTDEVDLENGTSAVKITIPYPSQKVRYEYDEENKVYIRYANNTKQTDWTTKEDVTTKNIIITFAKNITLQDGSGTGRQDLKNIGTLEGYYITNGKAIKITCEKESRSEQTVYKDLSGNEINVNDGNTFIQICPIDADVEIEGIELPEEENTVSEE